MAVAGHQDFVQQSQLAGAHRQQELRGELLAWAGCPQSTADAFSEVELPHEIGAVGFMLGGRDASCGIVFLNGSDSCHLFRVGRLRLYDEHCTGIPAVAALSQIPTDQLHELVFKRPAHLAHRLPGSHYEPLGCLVLALLGRRKVCRIRPRLAERVMAAHKPAAGRQPTMTWSRDCVKELGIPVAHHAGVDELIHPFNRLPLCLECLRVDREGLIEQRRNFAAFQPSTLGEDFGFLIDAVDVRVEEVGRGADHIARAGRDRAHQRLVERDRSGIGPAGDREDVVLPVDQHVAADEVLGPGRPAAGQRRRLGGPAHSPGRVLDVHAVDGPVLEDDHRRLVRRRDPEAAGVERPVGVQDLHRLVVGDQVVVGVVVAIGVAGDRPGAPGGVGGIGLVGDHGEGVGNRSDAVRGVVAADAGAGHQDRRADRQVVGRGREQAGEAARVGDRRERPVVAQADDQVDRGGDAGHRAPQLHVLHAGVRRGVEGPVQAGGGRTDQLVVELRQVAGREVFVQVANGAVVRARVRECPGGGVLRDHRRRSFVHADLHHRRPLPIPHQTAGHAVDVVQLAEPVHCVAGEHERVASFG